MNPTLQPQKSFTIVHQIPNHTDSSTYYIQAVIRNSFTDVIIATIQLTNKGGQRFKYDWIVPADPSGEGFYISIVTSVYTDSGYTTKSENYGDDENTYLVQDRILLGRVGGNGGIDAFEVGQIVKKQLDPITKAFKKLLKKDDTEKPVEEEPMRWDEILSAVSDLKSYMEKCEESDDNTPIISKLDTVLQAIADKEITPVTDLAPILAKMDDDSIEDKADKKEILDAVDNIGTHIGSIVSDDITKSVSDMIDKKEFSTRLVTQVETRKEPVSVPQPRVINIKDLSQ